MRRTLLIALLLLALTGIVTAFRIWGDQRVNSYTQIAPKPAAPIIASTAYLYYTLKQSTGFVLARAPKGTDGQPLGNPQPIMPFSNGFGLVESDNVLSMQLSPDGHYLAIDGTGDHGELVWIYDTQQMKMDLTPANVTGNFLHWLPGRLGHIFLYRPMFPMGPAAPMDGNGWNPGLWEVDATTGAHKNIDIQVPAAYLVDAVSSPDGSSIIYSTTAGLGKGSDTWLMQSDGSGRSHLFSNPGGAQSIAALFTWSPDGTMIAYERLSDSPTPFLPAGLWVMNTRGEQQHHLADTDGGHGYIPAWSPDSRKIAHVMRTNVGNRQADTQMQALQTAIAVVDVVTNRSWLVASADQTGVQININPLWTANSASITFTASNPANHVLGGMPRYWSANATGPRTRPSVSPLTPVMMHVIAAG